jgi:hypothetical protein
LLDSGETYSKLMMKKIKSESLADRFIFIADHTVVADEAMEDGGDVTADASNGKRPEGESEEEADADDADFDMEAPGRCYDSLLVNARTNSGCADDPDMSDEELKKRAAARARAIMARKKREAADFDEEVAGERSKSGNVTGKSSVPISKLILTCIWLQYLQCRPQLWISRILWVPASGSWSRSLLCSKLS